MMVEDYYQHENNQHLFHRLIDTFHNHLLHMYDSNKHIHHLNIYHDYDMINHINSFLLKIQKSSKIDFIISNIRPGVIQSGRYDGVDIQIRPLGQDESEQT